MQLWMRCTNVLLLLLVGSASSMAGEVRVAVAANFTVPAQQIVAQFQADTGHTVVLSFGATGKFYSQIKAMAPFDVLLAADDAIPVKLAKDGLADAATMFTYAVGKLVLWSKMPNFVDANGQVLYGDFATLAIADPKLAPYGLAAQEALINLQLWQKVQEKLIMGESIAQTMQFADTGNVELAFVALSQTIKDGKTIPGSQWLVPTHLYHPLRQVAVRIITSEHDQDSVMAFLSYLKSPKAVAIIEAYGYDLP